jgi:hypothetical protein
LVLFLHHPSTTP